jgi:hypothetical protein
LQQHPADQIVCLGDMIQGGPQPAEVVARLRTLDCPVVMGNADAWLLTGLATDAEPTTERQLAVREWQLTRLTTEDRGSVIRFSRRPGILNGGFATYRQDDHVDNCPRETAG